MKKFVVLTIMCLIMLVGVEAKANDKEKKFRDCILGGKSFRECMVEIYKLPVTPNSVYKAFSKSYPKLTSGYGVVPAPIRVR